MNFALSDEQELLTEAARGALSRVKTVEAAREALDGGSLPDLWPTAIEAGWTGLLVSEERGGAGLGAIDAMLVFAELGRVLAGVPLLGHLPASLLLDRDGHPLAEELAAGTKRAAFAAAKPPSAVEPAWTTDPRGGLRRAAAPEIGETVSGEIGWVPDAPGADAFVVVGAGGRVALVQASDASVEPITGYDATRSLGHVRLDGAAAEPLDLAPSAAATAWYLAQGLIAAEAVGAIERALETSVAYAKERFTFGRAIGSYQAIKHGLTEVLRLLENARSLLYYAGYTFADRPAEFPLAASAARSAAGRALDFAARQNITTHGGIGATWEHDAPLFFRRAQLSRRLLGGTSDATDRVAGELLAAADAA